MKPSKDPADYRCDVGWVKLVRDSGDEHDERGGEREAGQGEGSAGRHVEVGGGGAPGQQGQQGGEEEQQQRQHRRHAHQPAEHTVQWTTISFSRYE